MKIIHNTFFIKSKIYPSLSLHQTDSMVTTQGKFHVTMARCHVKCFGPGISSFLSMLTHCWQELKQSVQRAALQLYVPCFTLAASQEKILKPLKCPL